MKTLTLLVFASVVLKKADGSCPSDWIPINGRCFRYMAMKRSWANAEKVCLLHDANLASVHSAEEYFEIQKMIAKVTHAYERTWLGGSDCQYEGIWLWSDGTPFSYRHCGKFDNFWWKQHCLQMNYGKNKCWDDEQCSHKLPFVCVKKNPSRRG